MTVSTLKWFLFESNYSNENEVKVLDIVFKGLKERFKGAWFKECEMMLLLTGLVNIITGHFSKD